MCLMASLPCDPALNCINCIRLMRHASSCYPDETKETLPECRGGMNIDVMLTLICSNSRDLIGRVV